MSRSDSAAEVSVGLLANWPLPRANGSKASRGDVVIVGGSQRAPGAAILAGLSALRVGAGRLTLAVPASIASAIAVAVPEAGVVALTNLSRGGTDLAAAMDEVRSADAVLMGPGLDDIADASALLRQLARLRTGSALVIDAYGLGALSKRHRRKAVASQQVLTPNRREAEILLGRGVDDLDADCLAIARNHRSTISCFGTIATPDGRIYHVAQGGPGLGTSGSGDVLAGAISGLLARGCDPAQAAVWGTYLHAQAGRALSGKIGELGYLARDISAELPAVLNAAQERV